MTFSPGTGLREGGNNITVPEPAKNSMEALT